MNRPPYVTDERLYHFIDEAIKEDIGDGDHSTLASVPADLQRKARLLIKHDCILAGVDLAQEIFHYYDKSLEIEVYKNDGDSVKEGDIAFIVSGSARSILTMERLVLNCMQRMSGIATYTHEMVELLADTDTRILDTRKTSPIFRMCEKWAVYIGGGKNHRYGLFDMIMLKDNHNDYAGSITKAVEATVKYLKEIGKDLQIEVETRNLKEVEEALATKAVDVIMLDNMSIFEMAAAVQLINGAVKVEASGGITKESVHAIAETGVDYISSGAIIYAAPNIDLSLKAF
ncbi:MAG: carboxylating nicotinate-nucleotide diphosphorylase [Dysgonomonas sp.]|jgi:nicotinate-nucleotide pyrophosphorylase (carboxylating)|uniref:carboxylating nicotinate-nucleotide diphosphorylase n=1 Tax=unclassified Dysgonomonas TaxID=2630389 RepID=UPI0025C65806|nr:MULTISPECIES: carboxylating nicotinate-nucleotide diphosphorylase [unclassified Dysgonomonas]MDR1715419.1 carboxylating nicotinate-nucleotide diphosphorylase [Prevotella sp.]MDR2002714.1 carboxylating nicotinate-nucleotide diphosphorylase [Prevotella sp.]HMM03606.1 carboxylating nicotinate-nucleotide diphosphorylase [Dysgonomonas sp.]